MADKLKKTEAEWREELGPQEFQVTRCSATEPAFTGLEVTRPDGIAPVLAEALAYLEGRVESVHDTGDHHLLIGRVVGGRLLGEGQPMVHVRKSGMHY